MHLFNWKHVFFNDKGLQAIFHYYYTIEGHSESLILIWRKSYLYNSNLEGGGDYRGKIKKQQLDENMSSFHVQWKRTCPFFQKKWRCSADKLFPSERTPSGTSRNQFREAIVFAVPCWFAVPEESSDFKDFLLKMKGPDSSLTPMEIRGERQ